MIWVLLRKRITLSGVKAAAQQGYSRLVRTLVREEGNFTFNFDNVHGGIETGVSLADIRRPPGEQGCLHLVLRTWLPPSSPGYVDIWQRRNSGCPHPELLRAENRNRRIRPSPTPLFGRRKRQRIDTAISATGSRARPEVSKWGSQRLHQTRSLLAMREHLQATSPPLVEQRCDLDQPDSDNEETIPYALVEIREETAAKPRGAEKHAAIDWEVLFAEITSWNVNPAMMEHRDVASSVLRDNDYEWLRFFLKNNQQLIKQDASCCLDDVSYANHWRVLQHIEFHFKFKQALFNKYKSLRRSPMEFGRLLPELKKSFVRLEITKVQPSRLLLNFKFSSVDANLNRHLAEALLE